MCGIAGIIKKEMFVESSELKELCYKLNNRGPDEEGYYTSTFIDYEV